MNISEIPNFEKKNITNLISGYDDFEHTISYEEVINQFQKEIFTNQMNPVRNFWWDENVEHTNYYYLKIRNAWTNKSDKCQDMYDFLKGLFGNEVIDLSFQNGLLGLLLWLSKKNQKENDVIIQDFLDEAIKFLLSKKMKLNADWKQFSFFPEAIDAETWTSNNILSWAVGDLHVVRLLYRHSMKNFNNDFSEIAENIGLYATTRIHEAQNRITNSSLANGSIGLALVYRALYQETEQLSYLKSSNYWLERTEQFLELELENGYFKGQENSFLEGLKGIRIVMKELQHEGLTPILDYLVG
jgi:hypothetical protein